MTNFDPLPTALPVSDEEDAPLVTPLPDPNYGYTLPGRRAALVVVVCMVLAFFVLVALFLPQARAVIVPLCLSMVPLIAVALVAVLPLVAAGEDDVPAAPLLAGWLVILGGAGCDIYATVSHSPNLAQEANPVLRGLLDAGVSLDQVYLFAGILQLLYIGLSMALWLGLLKHRHSLAATMPPHGSLLEYFKAGTGGRELSYRQWLCPLTYAELPWAYHFAWWGGVAFVGGSAYRFYLALEWYQIAPTDRLWVRLIAPSVVLFATCLFYALWLRHPRQHLDSEPVEQ